MKKILLCCLLTLGVCVLPRTTMSVSMSIVTVTAYHPGVYGGHNQRRVTASGKKVKEGMVAVSQDVERMLSLDFGDRVLLHGLGVFEFQDRMSYRKRQKVDIFMRCLKKARRFGIKRHVLLVKLA